MSIEVQIIINEDSKVEIDEIDRAIIENELKSRILSKN